jgi:superfamily II DNA/RNA helicase
MKNRDFMDFKDLFGDDIAQALAKQGITEPTDIQFEAAPDIISGADLIAQAPTGTGKTLAYLAPLYCKLEPDERNVRVIILTPSYELAAQVHKQAKLLWDNLGMADGAPCLLVGGTGVARQIEALKLKPRVITGTPGRVLELIKLRKLRPHLVKTLVLDEGDRLLLGDFKEAVKDIIKALPRDRQVLVFSATMTERAKAAAREYAPNAGIMRMGNKLPDTITHKAVICKRREKLAALRSVIHNERIRRGLVFFANGTEAEHAAEQLNFHHIPAAALSARSDSQGRKAALTRFRDGAVKILTSTDAAARGMDIEGLDCVINADAPKDTETYLHRAGRTGRMMNKGMALTLATENEARRLGDIAKALGIDVLSP